MLVIFMLIISEPAGAVTVKMDTSNMPTTVGQTGYFYFNVTIGGNEKIPVTNFALEIDPPSGSDIDLNFTYNEVGTTIGNNKTIGNYNIKLVDIHGWTGSDGVGRGYNQNYDPKEGYSKGYGYGYIGYGFGYDFTGYGYGYGENDQSSNYTKVSYKITVNTAGAPAGTYDIIGKVYTGDNSKPYFSSTSQFTLAAKESPSGGSSSGGSSRFSWTTPTSTPVPTKTEDTTQGQATPIKTEKKDEVSTGEETQTPTIPTETEDGGLPGFTAIMFIAGLLGAAYIIMRKRG